MAAENPGLRLSIIGIVAVSLFAALFVRMFTLQVLQRDTFQDVAAANRLRVVHEQAPRGRILDRNQQVLVDSHEVMQVTVDVRALPTAEAEPEARRRELTLLAAQLNTPERPVTVASIEDAIKTNLVDVFAAVPVLTDVSDEVMVALLERQEDLPGIGVRRTAIRQYPYGSLAAHVLGYVGSISQEKLDEIDAETDNRNPLGYESGDEIGRNGLELAYEDQLRGTPGEITYEVDAEGNIVRTVSHRLPVPGHDLLTTLDLNVQMLAETELAGSLERVRSEYFPAPAGSVVVLDPNDGGVVAMASYPTFNPGDFTNGISQADYTALTDPNGDLPLNNRAIQGQYAPGSTFKPITAVAALDNGVRTPQSTIDDPGEYTAQDCEGDSCVFRNDESTAHGAVDLRWSLEVSSDYYYYEIGDILWLRRDEVGEEALQTTARSFGLGEDTGIELPFEGSGVVPTPDRKAQNHRDYPDAFPYGDWVSGDNINLSIGQGDLLVTPLQLANAYAALANGGTIWRPHLATNVVEPSAAGLRNLETLEPSALSRFDLPPDERQPIVDGLVGVTSGADGTAVRAFENNPAGWPVGGKTGTAQVTGKANSSVFAGFGPVLADQPPQYVATAILEEAGYGGDVAAPLIARIFAGLADPAQLPVASQVAGALGSAVAPASAATATTGASG